MYLKVQFFVKTVARRSFGVLTSWLRSMASKVDKIRGERNLEAVAEMPCSLCQGEDVSYSRLIALHEGGSNSLDNLLPLCIDHNCEKADIGPKKFWAKYHRLIIDFRIRYKLPPLKVKWMLD